MLMTEEEDVDPWMLAKFLLEEKIKADELLYGKRKITPKPKSRVEYHAPKQDLFGKSCNQIKEKTYGSIHNIVKIRGRS